MMSYKGKLLVAHPDLLDPDFYRTIIYVAHHDKNGAIGLVMNRPTGAIMSDAVSKEEPVWPFFKSTPVMQGGPVGRHRLATVLFEVYGKLGKIRAIADLNSKELEARAGEKRVRIYAFHGHTGWDAGQLEAELRDKSWYVRPADETILNSQLIGGLWPFLVSGDQRWRKVINYLPRESGRN